MGKQITRDLSVDCGECPLRLLEVFHAFTASEVGFMKSFKTGEMKIEAGGPVMAQDASSPFLFTVLSGYGVRTILLEDGRRQVVGFVFPGDFLGLQNGVIGVMRHGIEATTEMHLCVFPRDRLWDLFKSSPERAFDLTWLASREERALGESLTTVGRKTARERVAFALCAVLRRSERLELVEDRGAPMPWTQQDLADALGLSHVHVNRTLKRLRAEGLVALGDGYLSAPDFDRLAAIGHFDPTLERPRPLI